MFMCKVVVLMSTYNGEKYIEEQINSILAQEGVSIELFIRDDGSTDRTVDIIKRFGNSYTNIHFYQGKNVRPCKSFLELMNQSYDADYIALADQDDVWDSDKLKKAVEMIAKEDTTIPVLYYSNLRIVDSKLNFCRNSHAKPLIQRYKYEPLVENLVTGCTAVYNKKMMELLVKYKVDDFSMHDTLLYMIASIFGKAIYDFEPHISYRQHDSNVVGTYKKNKSFGFYWNKIKRLFDRNLQPRYNNACIFYNTFRSLLKESYIVKFNEIISYKESFVKKLSLLCDKDIRTNENVSTLRLKLIVLFGLL